MGCIFSKYYGMDEYIHKLSKDEIKKLNIKVPQGTPNYYIIIKSFIYKKESVVVPVGFVCDLCSVQFIPKFVNWRLFLMHDWFYSSHRLRINQEEMISKKEADEILDAFSQTALHFTKRDERAWKNSYREYVGGRKIFDFSLIKK